MHTRSLSRLLLGAAAMLLALYWRPAHAEDTNRPLMLVANPHLGEFYAHTVLVVIPLGDDRHVGLIINRPSESSLASLFPEHEPSRKVVAPVYVGGPVMSNSLFAVVRAQRPPGEGSILLLPGLFLVAHVKTIDQIIEQEPNAARYYVGIVAWQPGELDEELRKGFWYVMQPDPDLLFREPPNGMWEELVKRAGVAKTRVDNGREARGGWRRKVEAEDAAGCWRALRAHSLNARGRWSAPFCGGRAPVAAPVGHAPWPFSL